MRRFIARALVVFSLASCPAFGAATAQSYAGGITELAINGVACGPLYSVEGGDPRAATVAVTGSGGTALPKKQINGVSYAQITAELAIPPEQPIIDWIADLCANRQTRKTLLLTRYNFNGQAVGSALQANNTLLTEVRFPVLDSGAKDPVRLTLVFTPESTQAVPVPAASATKTAATKSKSFSSANFRIQIGTLPSANVSLIESITIKQPVTKYTEGGAKQVVLTPGTTEFSNLVLTIGMIDIAAWTTWRDGFVVSGKNDDGSETTASLELLTADMKTTLLTLDFSHMGIMRASLMKEASGSDAASRFQAELYFESMAIGTAPGKTSAPVAASPAPVLTPVTTIAPSTATMVPLPAGTAPVPAAGGTASSGSASGAAGAAAGGAAGAAGSTTAGGTAAGAAAGGGNSSASGGAAAGTAGITPASSGGSPAAGGAAAAGGSAAAGAAGGAATTTPATVAADQGARDIKDFPRPDGTVRKSYTSNRQKTYTQEIVTYSAKGALDALEEFYTKNLTTTGWELNTRVENDNSVAKTHQIVMNWVNALRSVSISIAEVKTGGSEITANLTTKVQ